MHSTAWLVRRAALAVGLMVGFYALAILVAVVLLWIPYAEWRYLGRVTLQLALPCIGGASVVLWAILPRRDRFEPPGPELRAPDYPALFALIRGVADATGQRVPAEVYALNHVNAFVTQRGGLMGIGGRQVMGIGFPLLLELSVDELRAVLAHEFGHYASGDVGLGPWVYKTRAAIGRTIESVRGRFVARVFEWYGTLFLKLTHAVSRRQEFIADGVAAAVAGPQALASALSRVEGLDAAYAAYLRLELSPLLSAGVLPPVALGFSRFLRADNVEATLRQVLGDHLAEEAAGELATHPTLRERLTALGVDPSPSMPGRAAESSWPMLGHPDSAERLMTDALIDVSIRASLREIAWEQAADVYLEMWRTTAGEQRAWLAAVTADTIPLHARAAAIRAGSQSPGSDGPASDEPGAARVIEVLVAGLGVFLADRGWLLHTDLGRPLAMQQGDARIIPAEVVPMLASGELSEPAWKTRCDELGLTGCLLVPPPTA